MPSISDCRVLPVPSVGVRVIVGVGGMGVMVGTGVFVGVGVSVEAGSVSAKAGVICASTVLVGTSSACGDSYDPHAEHAIENTRKNTGIDLFMGYLNYSNIEED